MLNPVDFGLMTSLHNERLAGAAREHRNRWDRPPGSEPSRRRGPLSLLRMRRAVVGPALIAVCALHSVFGLVAGGAVLADIARRGWVGAFNGLEEQVVLWFLLTGLVGIVAGLSITQVEAHRRLPWSVTILLATVAVFGVLAAPSSGFWLVLAVGLLAIARSAGWGHPQRRPPCAAAGAN